MIFDFTSSYFGKVDHGSKSMRDDDYKRAVEAAAIRGAKVQCRIGCADWSDGCVFQGKIDSSRFEWGTYDWRVAPEPEKSGDGFPEHTVAVRDSWYMATLKTKCPHCNMRWEIRSTWDPDRNMPAVSLHTKGEATPKKEWELIGTGTHTVASGWWLKFGERVKVVEVLP